MSLSVSYNLVRAQGQPAAQMSHHVSGLPTCFNITRQVYSVTDMIKVMIGLWHANRHIVTDWCAHPSFQTADAGSAREETSQCDWRWSLNWPAPVALSLSFHRYRVLHSVCPFVVSVQTQISGDEPGGIKFLISTQWRWLNFFSLTRV